MQAALGHRDDASLGLLKISGATFRSDFLAHVQVMCPTHFATAKLPVLQLLWI